MKITLAAIFTLVLYMGKVCVSPLPNGYLKSASPQFQLGNMECEITGNNFKYINNNTDCHLEFQILKKDSSNNLYNRTKSFIFQFNDKSYLPSYCFLNNENGETPKITEQLFKFDTVENVVLRFRLPKLKLEPNKECKLLLLDNDEKLIGSLDLSTIDFSSAHSDK